MIDRFRDESFQAVVRLTVRTEYKFFLSIDVSKIAVFNYLSDWVWYDTKSK